MDILSLSPLPEQIENCIETAPLANGVDILRLVTALLKYTVPGTYLSLPTSCQKAIARVFRSSIGLGNLAARIQMLSRLKTGADRDIAKALDAHTQLLDKVLAPGLVREIFKRENAVSRKETEKLLFKCMLYSIVREAAANFGDFHVPLVLKDMYAHITYLTKELVMLEDAASLSVALLSLGTSAPYFDVLFSQEYGVFLRRTVLKMKRFERKQVLVKFLDFALLRYLKPTASKETVAAVSVLSKLFLDNAVWDEILLEKLISRYNYNLNTMVALLLGNAPNLVNKLLAAWGSSSILANEPIVKQGYRTHLLLCLCAQLTSAELQQEILKLTAFVSAITARLSSLSDHVKFLGVLFTDQACAMAETPPIFDMKDIREMRKLDIPVEFVQASDFTLSLENAWCVLESPQIVDVDVPETDMKLDLESLTLQDTKCDNALDANMSDEEDDPTIGPRAKIQAPIYIRDLLAYLSVDTKDTNAYEKRKIALNSAPSLLRQKLGFGSEVSFYAQNLLAQLVGLTNHYDEVDFETSRLNAMIAVVVSFPDITPHLCKLLLSGDYSLQQRLSLLSAMSFSARALRGYNDIVVERSFTQTQFPTQMLPKRLHDQYTTADYGYSRIENMIQNELMSESAEEARDELIGGKVLRVSAKLTKQAPALEVSKDKLSTFNDIVGKHFFFPLVAVWYESGGINIGHYTPVLIAHYIRTLSLILHCAYPAALDLKDMAGEYLTLVTSLLQKIDKDQLQVIESIATGVLLICEMLDDTYLLTHFEGNLRIIESIIQQWWESLIDDRVKSLCAGLLLKLNRLKESMERTILDQMNGGFYS